MPFVNNKTGRPARADQELLVFPGEDFGDPDGLGVIVYGDGRVSGRWGDGVAGLSEEARVAAEDETDAFDPYTKDFYVWNSKVKVTPAKHKPAKRSSRRASPESGMRMMRG